ncbi:MAG TPA: hypothetical protein VEG43_02680 [Dehalococcoidia bacterium]|nr:hypothetical protein [Dehalococcoidia bacterium]
MIKERTWPVRAMYILIAAALAIGLFITAAPAQKVSGSCTADVCAEWTRSDTPTMDGYVVAPQSTIYDYALASEGDVAYAVVYAWNWTTSSPDTPAYRLLKSEDGAATWTDLTKTLVTQLNDDGYNLTELLQVATDWVDPDFVAVALVVDVTVVTPVHVYVSTDGGDTFVDTGEVEAGGAYVDYTAPHYGVSDLAVSLPVGDVRDIAIGGMASGATYGTAGIFRCTVTGDNPGAWKDATTYNGWNDSDDFTSYLLTDIIFSPNWATDRTILVTTIDDTLTGPGPYDVHLQSGTWGKTSSAWNAPAGFADAVMVKEGVPLPTFLASQDARGIAGIALPSNYAGDDSSTRYAWVWVNYYDIAKAGAPAGEIIMINDSLATPINQQITGNPWLTNVSYLGTIAQGKAIAGVLGDGSEGYAAPCVGVRVYHNKNIANMNICCLPWEIACKLPTGMAAMAVSYVDANNAGQNEPDKAYAVALQNDGPYDESAWSVSVDGDGLVWNQISLVDTDIHYISDVAVSPDCNKMMLVTVNDDQRSYGCDSVWLYADTLPEAEEYSGHWVRTWCGELSDVNSGDFPWAGERGLLRLAPEETTGDTVYLVDRGTNTIYYNDLETWDCWKKGTSTIDYIVDLAVQDESTIYALGDNGEVAMSDDHGKTVTWTDPVDSQVDRGWTIAVHSTSNNVTGNTYVLVGGQDGDVSVSNSTAGNFTALEYVYDASDVHVTVAFDTYFDTNHTIYAALANAGSNNGIFLWVIDTSKKWTNLNAHPYNYTGLVLSNINGNPHTSAATGGVLYASYSNWWTDSDSCSGCNGEYTCLYTGVARCLQPIVTICCGGGQAEWDYLTYGLETSTLFRMPPQALKMCGCLTPDTDAKLFAIDGNTDYNLVDGQDGSVWTFEDCYAKKAVELTSPADGFVVPASACGCCNVPFVMKWNRLCDACTYEIQFALDKDFTEIVTPEQTPPVAAQVADGFLDFSWYTPAKGLTPSAYIGCYDVFQPGSTYYWRIRAVEAEPCQDIKSWWSTPQSFTVAPTAAAAAIDLVSPVPGATDVAIKSVGFSWHLLAPADTYDWVLSTNADLSSPFESKTGLTHTAYTCTKNLTHGTTYYWQVTAYKAGAAISVSAVGTFTTGALGPYCDPIDGLCFDTQKALTDHEASAHPAPATPFWVWVVIAIGAVLVIVVIVLIFRTRRV